MALALAQPAMQLSLNPGSYAGWETACMFNTLLGYGAVASKLGSSGSASEWNPGYIKLCGMNIDPATGKEQGAAYGFKGTGEPVLPDGCTKRIYPSQMAEIDAEKTALMAKVASIYKPFL